MSKKPFRELKLSELNNKKVNAINKTFQETGKENVDPNINISGQFKPIDAHSLNYMYDKFMNYDSNIIGDN